MVNQTDSKAEANRAAIYARVSHKSQAEDDKTSISEQITEMEAHCQRRGLTIVARYQEVGRGWSKTRPKFQRMLADARNGRFDTIVCWKSDRLSRGMYPAAALMEVVEAHQITLEAVTDAIDMKTFGLMAAIGKIELDNFRERSALGRRGAAKQGRIPANGTPFGYQIGDDGKPQINQTEAEIVRRIFDMYVHQGLGAPSIARRLTDADIPRANRSKQWLEPHIQRILKNEAYKGTWWYGKTRQVATDTGRKIYDQPKDTWIQIPFPPLVDEETWNRAQTIKAQRMSRAKRNTKTFYLLQHLVRCAECGFLLGGRTTKRNVVRRHGKVYEYDLDPPRRYYKCYGMQSYRTRCREHPFIRAERLEDLVWSEVKKVVQNPNLIVAGIHSLEDQEADDTLAEQIAQAERDLRDVQMEEDRAIRLFVSGKITEDQLDHQRKFITERLEHCRNKLDDCLARKSMEVEKRAVADTVIMWAREVDEGMDDMSPQQRQEVLRLIIDRVTIDRDNVVRITLAVPSPELVAIEEQASSIGRWI